jgi:hypothetical protein
MPATPAAVTDVELAEFGQSALQSRLQPRGVADVGLRNHYSLTGFLDQPRGLVEILPGGHRVADGVDVAADVDRDDVGALLGQPDGVTPALATARSRDECDLARYPALRFSHNFSSWFHEQNMFGRYVFRPPLTPRIWPVM